MSSVAKRFDCLVLGSCVVDIIARPVDLNAPVMAGALHRVEPVELTAGGITANAGIAMSRLGLNVGVCSLVGDDLWGGVLRDLFDENGIATDTLQTHASEPTSTTVVLVDDEGDRSFLHCVGAPKTIARGFFETHMDAFAASRMLLLGYYSLMPGVEDDLPEMLAEVRRRGCKTAMDAAGDGGGMQPLDRILPHLDLYVPSLNEASNQTQMSDPVEMIQRFRQCGAPGILGVKLGEAGVLLSPADGDYVTIDVVTPPDAVVDTTGAGDCFYGGLIAGLLKGMDVGAAGRLGAATAACSVTRPGGWAGTRGFAETVALVGR